MKKYKNFIKLEKINSRYGFRESNNGSNLGNLHTFLSCEFFSRVGAENWKRMILDDNCKSNAGNEISMLKNCGEVSVISQFVDIYTDDDWFTTTKEGMVRIIDEWFDLVENQPAEIVIFEDKDGHITMKGYDKPTPAWTNHDRKILPRYFAIKLTTVQIDTSMNDEWASFEELSLKRFNEKLKKYTGEAFLTDVITPLGADEESKLLDWIFVIRYDKEKTIQDIANQFPEFTWIEDRGYFVWEKEETDQLFFDKKIEKVEIYTQN